MRKMRQAKEATLTLEDWIAEVLRVNQFILIAKVPHVGKKEDPIWTTFTTGIRAKGGRKKRLDASS